jgi:hypothetical protein
MKFALAAVVFMYLGRRFGWGLSKAVLYTFPLVFALVVAIGWGIGIGFAMSGMIGWLQPGVILRWILGFGLAAYVAVPNFGLLDESTIPIDAQARHTLVSFLPLIAYIITEFATRSMRIA